MKYHEMLLLLTILSAGVGVAHRDSMAMASEAEHHHHGMAAPGTGYKRAIVSYQTPDVKLVDKNGKPVSLHSRLDGDKPVMLNFIFTTCTTICPVTSATFSIVQEKLGPEQGKVHFVSISIDPEHDTPARLNDYAKKFGAGAQWSMLTGSAKDSIAVQRAFDVYSGDKMNHRPVTFMRKGPGKPWLRIDGFASADDLLQEYRKLALN
ncbi:SCO family protein [Candidatus Ferrigenium straubiae]|jgi:protein SCO1/2|uniref:SCO family protein n=1 Tax=Candidatus Ferrigenium straubiae TaxID=2919506 RepID=UPI003F4ABCAA